MSNTTDLLTGLAAHIAAAGAGTWAPSSDTGTIYRGALPPDLAKGVGLQGYRVGGDDPQHPTTQQRVQFFMRAPTQAELDDMAQTIYNAVHGLTDVTFGAVHVTQAISRSSIPQGVDGNGNLQLADNYTFDLDVPATALRSY